MTPLGAWLPSSETGFEPPQGDVMPPLGVVMVSGVAGDAPEFRVRTVSIATCCDLYEFERTVPPSPRSRARGLVAVVVGDGLDVADGAAGGGLGAAAAGALP